MLYRPFFSSDDGPPEKVIKTDEMGADAEQPSEELVVKISTVRPVEDFLASIEKDKKTFDKGNQICP